ncbi:copper-binding protein [Streptomyces albus subsp. albus]|nr:copper-binding protein [Streptomyces albus subsp. albus]
MAHTPIRRNLGWGVAAAALAGVLAACGGGGGGGGGGSSSPSTPAHGHATQVNVKLVDFSLHLSQKTFKAGNYTFVAKNDGSQVHALEITGSGAHQETRELAPGQSARFTVTLKSGATYQLFCPVDGHRELGMKTTLTVGGGTTPNPSPSRGGGY